MKMSTQRMLLLDLAITVSLKVPHSCSMAIEGKTGSLISVLAVRATGLRR